MSILIDRTTKVLVQGITGKAGSLHARLSKEYGTQVVAGVTPGRGGESVEGIPVFDTVHEAVEKTGANASMIFVPALLAADAILEAADAGIKIIACITEGIPILDMLSVRHALKGSAVRLIGPNCPGLITPNECRIGIMPGYIHKPGPVGVVSRSGTLTYESVHQLTTLQLGQSTCVGIGGDPIKGTEFVEILELFEKDPGTRAMIMIGEIGGSMEEEAAEFIRREVRKPVVGFIAGITAPAGRRMGHAGAIISQGHGTAQAKIEALKSARVHMVENPALIGHRMKEVLSSA